MSKKYYSYNPIELTLEDYKKGLLNNESETFYFSYFYKQTKFMIEFYKNIHYYCYEEDGIFYDLITGDKLTLIETEEKIEENKIYCKTIDLENINIDKVLEELKSLSRKHIKAYKKHINEEVKSKNYLEVMLTESNNKDRLEQKKKKEEYAKQKKMQRQINRINRVH